MIRNISAGLFSSGQIASIVIVSILLVGFLGIIGYLIYLLHKRGIHKLETQQLQQQRVALLQKLDDMRSGRPFEFTAVYETAIGAVQDDETDDLQDALEDVIEEEGEAEVNEETGAVVRYNRSFKARVIQADNDLKARYSELKNYILSFTGVKAGISWKRELFRVGRKSAASLIVRGKTLCLCLATDSALFEGTKYKVEAVSGRNNSLPCMYRVKSDRRMGYAKELIDVVMAGFNAERKVDYDAQDFTMPYKSTEVLVKKRLIKIIGNVAPDFEKEDAIASAKGIRYDRSFAARIIQSDEALKMRYSKLKNYLLAYDGVKCADNWKRETYRLKNKTLVALSVRGKTLCIYLATDPSQFANTKYKVEDYSLRSKNTDTPLMYRMKNDRRMKYAMQLIDKLFEEKNIAKKEIEQVNYIVPFTATETLIRRGLIRVVKERKPAQESEAAVSVDQNEDNA